ncbi:hypothetical protein [Streptomyces sioyaensis]|uniref:hypothetical protein n=1 Tax=Streptomyces sioyaensis TaxID=67364 RepID=UPI003D73B167
MSNSSAWVDVITAVSAAGAAAIVTKLVSEGAREAVRRIRRFEVRLGQDTITLKPPFKEDEDAVREAELDAEVFLRKYVQSQERDGHAEVERD